MSVRIITIWKLGFVISKEEDIPWSIRVIGLYMGFLLPAGRRNDNYFLCSWDFSSLLVVEMTTIFYVISMESRIWDKSATVCVPWSIRVIGLYMGFLLPIGRRNDNYICVHGISPPCRSSK